jgi:4a-hydroxytetrahydrobiopterin dehydratase
MSLADEQCRQGASLLNQSEQDNLKSEVPTWEVDQDKLVRSFPFPDFVTAFSFVENIKNLAEHHNHHPDILLSWGKVTVWWTTHDAGGITKNDFIMAAQTSMVYSRMPGH